MERKYIDSGGILDYDPDFIPKEEADILFDYLFSEVKWEQKYYTHRKTGAKYPQPRLTAWYADDPKMAYSYSGVTQEVQPWLTRLLELKQEIEKTTGASYNSVLLNFYRTGSDSVGIHADDERELGINANIASVSLGATRTFLLSQYRQNPKWQPAPGIEVSRPEHSAFQYDLSHGSLLVMSGSTQHYWKHEVPKMALTTGQINMGVEDVGPRINLTFRKFIV